MPRNLRYGVRERFDHRGNVITALDEPGLRAAARSMKSEGVEAVAVAFLHAFRNPAKRTGLQKCRRKRRSDLGPERGQRRGGKARLRCQVDLETGDAHRPGASAAKNGGVAGRKEQ